MEVDGISTVLFILVLVALGLLLVSNIVFTAKKIKFDKFQASEGRKILERDLTLQYQSLIQSISHELRTPLSTIKGIATMMQSQDDSDNSKFMASELMEASDRLEYMVSNFILLSRIDSEKLQLKNSTVDLEEIINGAIAHQSSFLGERKVVVVSETQNTLTKGDHRLLFHVFVNIIQNFVNFTPDGSQLRIGISNTTKGDLRITLKDNGPGLPEDTNERDIFKKFTRFIPENPGGAGIGMTVVKGVVELHNGEVEAKSAEGLSIEINLPSSNVAS